MIPHKHVIFPVIAEQLINNSDQKIQFSSSHNLLYKNNKQGQRNNLLDISLSVNQKIASYMYLKSVGYILLFPLSFDINPILTWV